METYWIFIYMTREEMKYVRMISHVQEIISKIEEIYNIYDKHNTPEIVYNVMFLGELEIFVLNEISKGIRKTFEKMPRLELYEHPKEDKDKE